MPSCAAPAGRKRSQTVRATAANDSSNDAATVRARTRKKGDIDLTRFRPNFAAYFTYRLHFFWMPATNLARRIAGTLKLVAWVASSAVALGELFLRLGFGGWR